jgi:hypothetical protein
MVLRFGAKVPELHEDSPLARLWIDKIAELASRATTRPACRNRFAGS